MRGSKAKAIRRALKKDAKEAHYTQINVLDKVHKKWVGGDEYEDIPYQTRTVVLHPESGRAEYKALKKIYKQASESERSFVSKGE